MNRYQQQHPDEYMDEDDFNNMITDPTFFPNSTQIGGDHYQKDVQPWAAMEAWMSEDQFIGYLWGNVIKYMARWPDKGGREDLKKAQHYLAKLLEHV